MSLKSKINFDFLNLCDKGTYSWSIEVKCRKFVVKFYHLKITFNIVKLKFFYIFEYTKKPRKFLLKIYHI